MVNTDKNIKSHHFSILALPQTILAVYVLIILGFISDSSTNDPGLALHGESIHTNQMNMSRQEQNI